MSFWRAHSEIDWIAVQPMMRSIMTMQEPSCLREFAAPVHFLHRAGGDVEVVALHLAAHRLGALHGLHAEPEAVAPVHERLRVDVLVVLGEVEPAASAS